MSSSTAARQVIRLSEKPMFTGAGPFIELPRFTAIGNPSNLLNITIPSSSYLNIKSGSLVAVDGDLNGLTSSRQLLTSNVDYQQLYAENAASVIISGNNHYSIIKVNKTENWKVIDSNNIIAWSGFTLELKPIEIFQKFFSFQTLGLGTLIVQGSNQLFEIDIDNNEELIINPNSLIATNSPTIKFAPLNNSRINWSYLNKWKLKTFNNRGLQIVSSYLKQFANYINNIFVQTGVNGVFSPVSKYYHLIIDQMKSGLDFITLNFIHPYSSKPIYLYIKGPCKLLLNNIHTTKNRSVFTKQEIHHTFQNKINAKPTN